MQEKQSRVLNEMLEFNVSRLDGVGDSPRFTEGMEFYLIEENPHKVFKFNLDKCRGREIVLRSEFKLDKNEILLNGQKELILRSTNNKNVKFKVGNVKGKKANLLAVSVLANYFPELNIKSKSEEHKHKHEHETCNCEHCNCETCN